MADEIDRYGLSAQFSFMTEGKSLTAMSAVVSQLGEIERAARSASTAVKDSGLGQNLKALSAQVNMSGATRPLGGIGSSAKQAANEIVPLRKEFRALKAEARNIEFPADLYDKAAWKGATQQVHQYRDELKALESQIGRNTTEEREFAAQLKSAQKIAESRVDIAGQQRKSAIAGERLGSSQAVQSVGQGITGFFNEPLAQSREFSKELSDIDKLAGYLTDQEEQLGAARKASFEASRSEQVKKDLIGLSNATGTARQEVSALYADLAGAGKSFANTDAIKAEADGILRVKTALDITTDAATGLDIQLGSTYIKSLDKYGGIVKLNERIGSSFNVLADELPNVKIDAEGVANIFTGLASAIGDVENFKPPDIAAFAATLNATGIEKDVASSFVGRLDAAVAGNMSGFAKALDMSGEDFSKMANTDYLSVIQKISEKFGSLGTVEAKGSFFASLGIGSAQDQKLIKGLAANTGVLVDARKLSNEGFEKATSIGNEYNKVQGKSAFQTERNAQLLSNFKTLLGNLLEQALLPFLKGANKLLEFATNFVQQNQGLVKAVVVVTYAIGALAVAIGTVGVAFFSFQQASATAEIAVLTMSRSLIPLTGFFETSMAAFAGGNPIKIAMNAIREGASFLPPQLAVVATSFESLGAASIAFLASPMGLAIAALTGLYLLLETVTPNVSILGTAVGALAAPFAFVFGIVKGFGNAVGEALMPLFGIAGAPLALPFQIMGDAISQVAKIWTNFVGKGEETGYLLAQYILSPFKLAAGAIAGLWQGAIAQIVAIMKPFADFADFIGQSLVSSLAENSPGPTFQIRQKWDQTVQFLQGLLSGFVPFVQSVGNAISAVFFGVGEVILNLGRSILMGALVRQILPKVIDGIFASSRGSTFSAQKIGNRLGGILSEALMFPFEGGVGAIAAVMVRYFLGVGELVESIFVNQVGKPVGQFIALFVPETLRNAFASALPGLTSDVGKFFEKAIVAPKEIGGGIGKRLITPILDALGWENFAPIVDAIGKVVKAVRPFFLLLETAIPGVVLAGLARLEPFFALVAVAARPLLPLFGALLPVLGTVFQVMGAVLVVADLLKNTTLFLRAVGASARFVGDTVSASIGLVTTILGFVQKGIGQIRVILRSGVESIFQILLKSVVAGASLAGSIILNLVKAAVGGFTQLASLMGGAASFISIAWVLAGLRIAGTWGWLVGMATGVRDRLVALLNHGSADAVAMAWERTQDTVGGVFSDIVGSAKQSWQQLQQISSGAIASVSGFITAAYSAVTNFNPVDFVTHTIAEIVRGFTDNLRILGVLVPAALQTYLYPALEKGLIPAILVPFARAVPLILGLLANLGGFNLGPDLPFREQIEGLVDWIRDDILSIGFALVGSFTLSNIAPFITQLKTGLTPTLGTIYQTILMIGSKIRDLGGIIPFLKYAIAEVVVAAQAFLSQIKLPPWLIGLAKGLQRAFGVVKPFLMTLVKGLQRAFGVVKPFLMTLVKGLQNAAGIAIALTRQFLALPSVQVVIRSVLAGARAISDLLSPILAPLTNWFVDSLLPGAVIFIAWIRQNLGLVVQQLAGAVKMFVESPLGQAVIKGGVAIASGAAKAGRSVVGAAITTGQKIGEAYVIANKVATQIQMAVGQIIPYLRIIATKIGGVVGNTAEAVKKSGQFYRSFYLQKAGVPAEIAQNAINPTAFLPGANAGAKRETLMKSSLMADPFWKAREGTELFDAKLSKLNKSFSGMGSGLNIFKTLPMLFTRPALAATIFAAQLELLLGVVLLVAAAAAYIYFRYPKTFHAIADVVTKYVIPAIGAFTYLLLKVIPPALIAITKVIDGVGRALKAVFFDIPGFAIVYFLYLLDFALQDIRLLAKVVQFAAKSTRILGHALWEALHGNMEELKAIGWLMESFIYDWRDLIINKMVGAWDALTGAISRNMNTIRSVIGTVMQLIGLGVGIAALLGQLGVASLGMATPILGAFGLVLGLLGLLILPGATLKEKWESLTQSFQRGADIVTGVTTPAFVGLVDIGKTVINWVKNLTKATGFAAVALSGLYLAIVIVAGGMNPLGLAIAGVGAFLTLSFTGHLETFAVYLQDFVNNILDGVRDLRENLLNIIMQPFNIDGIFQSGADAIAGFGKSILNVVPLILIGFTLFNTVFKTGGNFVQGFLKTITTLPRLFFKFMIQPIFTLIKALSNLSFASGESSRKFFGDFDRQTEIKEAIVNVRARKPLAGTKYGLEGDQLESAREGIQDRRNASSFRESSQGVLDSFTKVIKDEMLEAGLALRQGAETYLDPKEIEQIQRFTQVTQQKKMFGVMSQDVAELTEEGENYLKGIRAQMMRGTAKSAIGIQFGSQFGGDLITDGFLQRDAEFNGFSSGEGAYDPKDLRNMAFGKTGLQDFADGKIQKIYAEKVEIQSASTVVDGAQQSGGQTSTPLYSQGGSPWTPRGLLAAPLPKNELRDMMQARVQASPGDRGLATLMTNMNAMLDKSNLFIDLSTKAKNEKGGLSILPAIAESEYRPINVSNRLRPEGSKNSPQFDSFVNKTRYQEEVFLAADVLRKAGQLETQVMSSFKSFAALMAIISLKGNSPRQSDLRELETHMAEIGMTPDQIDVSRSKYQDFSKERDQPVKAVQKSYLADIYAHQYELLLQEMATSQSITPPPSAQAGLLMEDVGRVTDEASAMEVYRDMKSPKRTMEAYGSKIAPTWVNPKGPGSRSEEVMKRQMQAEMFELFRMYSYNASIDDDGDFGPQTNPALAIKSAGLKGATFEQVSHLRGKKAGLDIEINQIKSAMKAVGESSLPDATVLVPSDLLKRLPPLKKDQTQSATPSAEVSRSLSSLLSKTIAERDKVDTDMKAATKVPEGLRTKRMNFMLDGAKAQGLIEPGVNKEFRMNPDSKGSYASGIMPLFGAAGIPENTGKTLSTGKFEAVDPYSVRELATQLEVTIDELMAGVKMSIPDKLDLSKSRTNILEGRGSQVAKKKGLKGQEAVKFTSFEGLAQQAGLMPKDIRNVLMGTGSLEALDSLADILNIEREALIEKLEKIEVQVQKKKGFLDQIKSLAESPIQVFTQPLQKGAYAKGLNTALDAITAAEDQQKSLGAKRLTAFEAIANKIQVKKAGQTYTGEDAIAELLKRQNQATPAALTVDELKHFLKFGKFRSKDNQSAKYEGLKGLGRDLEKQLQGQGLDNFDFINLRSLENFNPASLSDGLGDRIKNQIQSYREVLGKVFRRGEVATDAASDATKGEAKKQISLLDKMATKPGIGKVVSIYREYQKQEKYSLEKMLQANKMSLGQLKTYMVDILDLPTEEYAKLLRGQEIKPKTMKAISGILPKNPALANVQAAMEKVRTAANKKMEGITGNDLIRMQNELAATLEKIEDNALKAFFENKNFSVKPMPGLTQYVLQRLLKDEAPKLFRKVTERLWQGVMKKAVPFIKKVAPVVGAKAWQKGSRFVGLAVRTLAGPLYKRFMPGILKTMSTMTGRLAQGSVTKLNALRGLFPRSKILAGLQKGILGINVNLKEYFDKTAGTIEAERNPNKLIAVIRSALQRVTEGFTNFIQGLPAAFDRAKSQAISGATRLINFAKGIFAKVIGLFRPILGSGQAAVSKVAKMPKQRRRLQYEQERSSPLAQRYGRMKQYKSRPGVAATALRDSKLYMGKADEQGRYRLAPGQKLPSTETDSVRRRTSYRVKDGGMYAHRAATAGDRRENKVGSLVASLGGILRGAATKANQFSPEAKLTRLADKARLPGELYMGKADEQGRFRLAPGQKLPSTETGDVRRRTDYKVEDGGMYAQREVDPLKGKTLRIAANLSQKTTNQIAGYFERAAQRSETAWQSTAQAVAGKSWGSMVKRAAIAGGKILGFISEASPGPSYQTRKNWEHTAESVDGSMHEMAHSAQIAGHEIEGAMQHSSKKSGGFFSGLKTVFGSGAGAGMAIGGAISASGFAMQQISSSLTTMGIMDEESSMALSKFSEIFSLLGAIGGLGAPIFAAIAGTLGAIVTIGGAVVGAVFSPIGLGVAAAAGGLLLLNEAAKQLFGVDVLGAVVKRVKDFLEAPLTAARDRILGAWQGLVDKFGPVIMPIVTPALELAQKLINALNHNPTEVIPAAWEGAIARIQEQFFGWLGTGTSVADGLKAIFDPSVLFGGMTEFFATAKLPESMKGAFGGLGGLFERRPKQAPKQAPEVATDSLPPVVLDQSRQFDQAAQLAERSGKTDIAAQLKDLKAQTGGQLAPDQIAGLMQADGGQQLGMGAYFQKATSEINFQDGVKQNLKELDAAMKQGADQIATNFSDRFTVLGYGADPFALFEPGFEQVTSNIGILGSDFMDFGKRAGTALLKLDFNEMGQAAKDFGGNFMTAAKGILSGFGDMSLSAVVFGVFSLTSISPVILVLGGIALASVAIATNFLGLRTIVVGLGKVAIGVFQVVLSLLRGVSQVIMGVGKMIGGIFAALRGDFTQLQEGAWDVFNGITLAADGMGKGLQNIFGGAINIIKGLFQGLSQIITGIKPTVQLLGDVLLAAIALPQKAWQEFLNLLSKIGMTASNVMEMVKSPGKAVGALKLRMQGKVPAVVPDGMEMAGFDQRLRGQPAETTQKPGFFGRMFGKKSPQSVEPAVTAIQQPTQAQNAPELNTSIPRPIASVQPKMNDVRTVATTFTGALSSVAPAIAAPAMGVMSLVDAFGSIGTVLPTLIGLFTSLGSILPVVGMVLSALASPLLLIGAGIAAVIAIGALLWKAWETDFGGIRDLVSSAWRSISHTIYAVLDGIGQAVMTLIGWILKPIEGIAIFLVAVAMVAGEIWQGVFGTLFNEIGKIWQSIQGLGAALLAPFQPLLGIFGGGGGGFLKAAVSTVLAPLKLVEFLLTTIIKTVSLLIQGAIAVGTVFATMIMLPIQGVMMALGAIGQLLYAVFVAPFQAAWAILQQIGTFFQTLTQQVLGFVLGPLANLPFVGQFFSGESGTTEPVQGYATGGWVTGPGTGTGDKIPAMLSSGEFVVPAAQAAPNAGFLNAIRSGMDVESALQVMPMATPPMFPAPGTWAADPTTELPPIEVNITFGDIILGGGGTGPDQVQEFLDAIEPQLEQTVRALLRRMVDMMK